MNAIQSEGEAHSENSEKKRWTDVYTYVCIDIVKVINKAVREAERFY